MIYKCIYKYTIYLDEVKGPYRIFYSEKLLKQKNKIDYIVEKLNLDFNSISPINNFTYHIIKWVQCSKTGKMFQYNELRKGEIKEEMIDMYFYEFGEDKL